MIFNSNDDVTIASFYLVGNTYYTFILTFETANTNYYRFIFSDPT